MKRKQKKLYVVSGVAVLILAGIITLITTKNYPSIIIGTNFISVRTMDEDLTIAKKIDPSSSDAQALDQLIKVQEQGQMVFGTSIAQPTVVTESEFLVFNQMDQYKSLMQNVFDNNQQKFLNFVVAPQVYDALLREKYNSDFIRNKDAYARAQNILIEINQGKAFEDIAKTESDDKVSGQLGGDMGFVQDEQILPEVMAAVQKAKLGEVDKQIVVSRVGYHIIYPVESTEKDGAKLWHLKQIFIQTSGYETWLNSQLSNFHSWRLK
jgi:hypothetical protein